MQTVRLLGGIEFSNPEAAAELSSRPKTLALLAWLAAHCDAGPRRREEVLALFWNDKELPSARNSLRQAIFRLRTAFGRDAITGRGGQIALDPTRLSCDLVALDQALRDGDDRRAVELFRGDLLHGLFIPRAPRAMEWLATARRARRDRVIDAASRLAAHAEEARDVDQTLRWARRAAELMPVGERPASQLAALMARAEAARTARALPPVFDALLDHATRDRSVGADNEHDGALHRADKGRHSTGDAPEPGERPMRLASVPLLNISGNVVDDALAEGLSAAVVEELGAVRRDIERVGSPSTRHLQLSACDAAATGDRLGVDAVLSGTMARQDGSLTLSLQLQHRDGRVLWADRVSGEAGEIDRLTQRIVEGLGTALPPRAPGEREVRRLRRGGRNQQAVVAVLRGSHFVWRLTPHDLQQALACFSEATTLDPASAPAWAGLGQTLLFLPIYSPTAPLDAYPRAIDALERAIALDPEYATSHAARAVAASVWEWDFDRAERLVQRAHELDPSDHEAWVADLLYVRAPLRQATASLAAARRLVELDPASPLSLAYAAIGAAFFDPTAARVYAQESLELEPSLPTAHWCLAGIALGEGDRSAALDHADLIVELTGGHPGFRAMRAFYSVCAGLTARAEEELHAVLAAPTLPETGRYYAALTCLHLGDREQALVALEREVAARNSMAIYLGVDPALQVLQDEPRFAALRARVGV